MVQEANVYSASSTAVTVIVPTLNEVENIDALLGTILAQATANLALDIFVADGGSVDGTIQRVRDWEARAPVRLVAGGGLGLAGDVLAAAEQTTSSVIVVMDADFSHPPTSIPKLVAPILAGTSDMVVGSRYVPGGSAPDWPLRRQILSRMGGALAWPLSDIRDPMSGFFAIRRPFLLAVDPSASGFKIGLEAMAAGGDGLRVTEVPIIFADRKRGTSKISLFQMAAFARRLMILAGGAVSMGTAARFATVGVLGIGVDYIAFTLLLAIGASLVAAHSASFILATVFNYTLNSQWSFSQSRHASAEPDWRQYARFLTVCLLAFFLRGGILATAVDGWGWSPEAAILLAIAGAAIVNYVGSAFFVFPSLSASVSRSVRLRVLAVAILGYVILLHLAFLGSLNLIPEEAYYWNYSQHLDIGYLDHPPMVAWLIWLGTKLGGHTEFAVRSGASLSWLVAGLFCFLLTRNLYGKTAAFVAVLMFCALPFFFTSGLLMTPDAPLTAAWAGTLYFLERALVGERREAWLGVGVCLGLGMLSKYTIALLGPATLLFVLLDPQLRRWLWHPAPYLAVAIATAAFSPVIVWNSLHDWASFSFQGARFNGPVNFSVHMLLGSILLLLTPVGLAAAAGVLFQQDNGSRVGWLADRRTTFIAIYTLVPLSAFLAFSVFHEVKLNWTGPIWLALLPALARNLAATEVIGHSTVGALRRPWLVTVAILLLAYGAALHYLALGLPGVDSRTSLKSLPIGWKEFGAQVEKIETDLENITGKEPLRIGMDRYFLSSEIAFYDPDKDAVPYTAGRSLFGLDSLMYDRWFSPAEAEGQDILLISRSSDGPIAAEALAERFQDLGPILEHVVFKNGLQLGQFYYRIGYNYVPYVAR
ncbi:MAG: glycosyltransferase family 39 protein [Methyloceanibacter sp.]